MYDIPDDPRIQEIERWGYPLSYINRISELEEDRYSGDEEWEGLEPIDPSGEADRRWSERFDEW